MRYGRPALAGRKAARGGAMTPSAWRGACAVRLSGPAGALGRFGKEGCRTQRAKTLADVIAWDWAPRIVPPSLPGREGQRQGGGGTGPGGSNRLLHGLLRGPGADPGNFLQPLQLETRNVARVTLGGKQILRVQDRGTVRVQEQQR